ncbi:MAG: DUF488 domain-containing protein [Calothrix sp. SM1_7_51]|nr:DUF488 domain-containing protein [Calothrix sp. SM1_7_51]
MNQKIYTIGHSNHSIETFIALLKQHQITALADVRSHPYSKRLPHFSKASLKASLLEAEITYVFLGKELGARPNNPLCYVDSKALYEKIAETEEFDAGIQRLIKGGETYKIALMCAEKDPITCHRAILVCQNLREHFSIQHILSNGELEPHQQLEERLLTNHGLSDQQITAPKQLSLFDEINIREFSSENLSLEARLKEAYHRQGNQIAYQDENT